MQAKEPKVSALQGFLSYIFPALCYQCNTALRGNENILCLHCLNDLAPLENDNKEHQPVFELFWGKANIEYASAKFNFVTGGAIQKLIHELKYNKKPNLAKFIAGFLAEDLEQNPNYQNITHLTFVPSSKDRKKERGYNQVELIAKELGIITGFPVLNWLEKKKGVKSQTSKNVFQRHELLESTFVLKKVQNPANEMHLLLIDDVITTGATTSACAKVLLGIPNVKVSVLAFAFRNLS